MTNILGIVESTPAQGLYVDSYRRSAESGTVAAASTPEMLHWKRSRLHARQVPVTRGALRFGHSFVLTELPPGKDKSESKGLTALKTSAIYEDPANDIDPVAALTITQWPEWNEAGEVVSPGKARMWDDRFEYEVGFKSLEEAVGNKGIQVGDPVAHGAQRCPVTRFAASVDLEGRTTGVVQPMMVLQDRLNQTVFDLLIAQTYTSTEARWVSGMAPPMQRDADGELILDDDGNPQPVRMNFNAMRMMFAEDAEARFGSLPASPLDGLISSISMTFQHISALGQIPPHYLVGQIANLSADALLAAEISLQRRITEFQAVFGESWERVFQVASEIDGDEVLTDDDVVTGEVVWRDIDNRSMAQSADALGKLAAQLSIPAQGLWPRVPGVTTEELDTWRELAEDADVEGTMAYSLRRATAGAADSQQAPVSNNPTGTGGDSVQTAKELVK